MWLQVFRELQEMCDMNLVNMYIPTGALTNQTKPNPTNPMNQPTK